MKINNLTSRCAWLRKNFGDETSKPTPWLKECIGLLESSNTSLLFPLSLRPFLLKHRSVPRNLDGTIDFY